jgi:hypothetical protein
MMALTSDILKIYESSCIGRLDRDFSVRRVSTPEPSHQGGRVQRCDDVGALPNKKAGSRDTEHVTVSDLHPLLLDWQPLSAH